MATGVIKAETNHALPPPEALQKDGKPRYKSFRKKYRKMRMQFEKVMEDANNLFIKEHKAWETAKRLREEIDQLQDVLVDVNDSDQTAAHLRYDIGYPPQSSASPVLSSSRPKSPHGNLPIYRQDGRIILDALQKHATHTPLGLPQEHRTTFPSDLLAMYETEPPGYMNSQQELEHLTALDNWIASIPSTEHLPSHVQTVQSFPRSREKAIPTVQQFAIHSPISVNNWLRKHEPKMFDTQQEAQTAKAADEPSKGRAGGRGKQAKLSKKGQEVDSLDEDPGYDPGDAGYGGGSSKKKKINDHTYRPKGGRSKAAAKRKRDGDEVEPKTTKRVKKSAEFVIEDEF